MKTTVKYVSVYVSETCVWYSDDYHMQPSDTDTPKDTYHLMKSRAEFESRANTWRVKNVDGDTIYFWLSSTEKFSPKDLINPYLKKLTRKWNPNDDRDK